MSREEIKERAKRMTDISEESFDVAELQSVKTFKILHSIACKLEELGYPCITDARNIIHIIDHFKIDTLKLPIPDGDYKKFRGCVLAGEYDTKCSDELTLTDEQKKYIDDAVKAGKAHIMY